MNLVKHTSFFLSIIVSILLTLPVAAQVSVDPHGMLVSMENEDTTVVELTLSNDGDTDLAFSIEFTDPPAEEAGRSPQRDEFDLDGKLFAVIQERADQWYFLDEWMLGPIMDELDDDDFGTGYHSYRGASVWDDIEFENYDAVIVAAGRQSDNFTQAYNRNLERFEAYIAEGGATYFETAFGECPVLSPGGIENVGMWESNGRLLVSPNREDDNYSLFAEICHESQADYWEEGHIITGNTWLDSHYEMGQFEDRDDIPWFQVIAEKQNAREACVVSYGYGDGIVMTVGSGAGKAWRTQTNDGQWGSIAGEILYYLTEMTGSGWIQAFPADGEISANNSEMIELSFLPIGMESGVYEMRIQVEFMEGNNIEGDIIELSAVMSIDSPVATVSGVITSEANDEVLADAIISIDRYQINRFSGDNGTYSIENLPLGEYELTFEVDNFLPYSEVIQIEEEGDVELNVALQYAEFRSNPELVEENLLLDQSTEIAINIYNDGNGPLSYSVERQIVTDAEVTPWQRLVSLPATELVDDNRLSGVAFIDSQYYVSAANTDSDDPPQIYILNRDGELQDSFAAPGTAHYGIPNLAWDGELLWGSGEVNVYGFTLDGEVQMTFSGPDRTNKGITWDSEREHLWICGVTSEIFAVDREGNVDAESELDDYGFRKYGLAFHPQDPDGYQLYILHDVDDAMVLHKMNVETNDTMLVNSWEPESGKPGGAFITKQLDVFSWVFVTLPSIGAGDRVEAYQIDFRKEWFQIEPTEGVIAANDSTTINLVLDATDLQENLTFAGRLYFSHDGLDGESMIDISLAVIEEEEPDGITDNDDRIPIEFEISSVYPNPFNSVATISFSVDRSEWTSLKVFDMMGREVATLFNGISVADGQNVVWEANNISSGLYFLRLQASDRLFSQKVMLIR